MTLALYDDPFAMPPLPVVPGDLDVYKKAQMD
jgi:hypothetical protein